MHDGPYDAGMTAEDRGHVIPGELVGTGYVRPGARSYDPLAGPSTTLPTHPTEIQPHTAPHDTWRAAGPMPLPSLPQKSVGVAFLLTFLFGPFGMFYSTVTGALVLLVISVVLSLVAGLLIGLISLATFGLGAFLMILAPLAGLPIWITSMIWGCLAASHHNDRVREQYAQHGAAHAHYGAQQAAAGGYGPARR